MNDIPKWLKDRPIAHRGLHDDTGKVPENSLLAFAAAINRNYPIEFDIYVVNDGSVVVFHDDNLKRMCGEDKLTTSLIRHDLDRYNLLGSDQKIPLLSEVMKLVAGKVPLLIEIKELKNISADCQKILTLIREYPFEFAIQSFNPFIMGWFSRHAPDIIRGQLSYAYKDEPIFFLTRIVLKNYYLNFISRPHFIAFDINDLPDKRVASLRKNGMPVLGWTVKSEQQKELVEHYCDNIIFEGFLPGHV